MNSDVRVGSSPILGTNINNIKFDNIMNNSNYLIVGTKLANKTNKRYKYYSIYCNCKKCGKPLFNAFIRNDGYAICQNCHIKDVIKEVIHN